MAQNVTIAGASYLGVPRIEMPKTGGGTAVFVDTSDANAAAGDITKGKTAYVGGTKITGTLEASSSGGAKETWVIKDTAPVDENSYELAKTDISFASAGAKFVAFEVATDGIVIWLKYYTSANTVLEPGSFEPGMGDDRFLWKNNAYKAITFDTPPTGALLTWLQSNAVKQPDDTAVQDTKAVTITSNGTVSVTPDAPYDALKKVDVTVDVASGGGGFNVSISIQRAFTGDTLVTGVMEKALPFIYSQGGPISMQAKMSEGGVVYTGSIATGSQTYEYIVNLLNVDVYLYTRTKGLVKQEITSFPYRFPVEVLAAIYIPVANNAIINATYYED